MAIIQGELGAKLLLLGVKKGQLRWSEHLISMPPETPLMMFQARPTGRRLWGSPGLTGRTPIWPGSALLSS